MKLRFPIVVLSVLVAAFAQDAHAGAVPGRIAGLFNRIRGELLATHAKSDEQLDSVMAGMRSFQFIHCELKEGMDRVDPLRARWQSMLEFVAPRGACDNVKVNRWLDDHVTTQPASYVLIELYNYAHFYGKRTMRGVMIDRNDSIDDPMRYRIGICASDAGEELCFAYTVGELIALDHDVTAEEIETGLFFSGIYLYDKEKRDYVPLMVRNTTALP
jgi:hypothetical protein